MALTVRSERDRPTAHDGAGRHRGFRQALWFLRLSAAGTAALAGLAAAAGTAHADNYLGALNPTFGNACTNHTSKHPATGLAAAAADVVSGSVGQIPVTAPRNDCGSQGIGQVGFAQKGFTPDRAAKTCVTAVQWCSC
ncbi:hypothetical protein [Streptomyces sp. FBKL.4005]|uniref:hypothetical protein n=1 Tax=Streptomyces sp. FBKL.4005 TaxID=2015515 RepID=UPI00117D7986|nr:hypothetical protein [Streptomyces sp. FBKL.4005]